MGGGGVSRGGEARAKGERGERTVWGGGGLQVAMLNKQSAQLFIYVRISILFQYYKLLVCIY